MQCAGPQGEYSREVFTSNTSVREAERLIFGTSRPVTKSSFGKNAGEQENVLFEEGQQAAMQFCLLVIFSR